MLSFCALQYIFYLFLTFFLNKSHAFNVNINPHQNSNSFKIEPIVHYIGFLKLEKKLNLDFSSVTAKCNTMARTENSPFIAFVLFKTSGRFLGMSSIIDRQTLITAHKVIVSNYRTPQNLLILAGSFSPWWGRYSQVRKVVKVVVNNYGIALLIIDHDWRFNKRVAPIQIPEKFVPIYNEVYGNDYAIFGITLENSQVGHKIPKSKVYEMVIQTFYLTSVCNGDVEGLVEEFNYTTEFCMHPNNTFCKDGMGSPVVSVGEQQQTFLVGVLVWSGCVEQAPYNRGVKISCLDKWIKSHSFLGFRMQIR